jgi:hypothetical protein
MHRVAALLLLACPLAACNSVEKDRSFRPVEASPEDEADTSPSGAYYELASGEQRVGQAKLWWGGVTKRSRKGEVPSEVRIGVRLRNDGQEPITLRVEDLALDVKVKDRPVMVVETPADVRGRTAAGPGETARVELTFFLPRAPDVDELRWVELSWALDVGEQRLSYSTPFVRFKSGRWSGYSPYYPYDPYYYPYYRGYPYYGYPYGFEPYPYYFY